MIPPRAPHLVSTHPDAMQNRRPASLPSEQIGCVGLHTTQRHVNQIYLLLVLDRELFYS